MLRQTKAPLLRRGFQANRPERATIQLQSNPGAGEHAETLAELVDALLTHGFKADVVEGDHGAFGIALMLDAWYTSRRNDFNLDAESVLPYWQDIVDRIRIAIESAGGR